MKTLLFPTTEVEEKRERKPFNLISYQVFGSSNMVKTCSASFNLL